MPRGRPAPGPKPSRGCRMRDGPITTLASVTRWFRPGRKKADRRAVKERKRRALSGGAEGWLRYDFFRRAHERSIAGIPDERCFTLQSVIRSLRDVPGDVAECGVRYGKSAVF